MRPWSSSVLARTLGLRRLRSTEGVEVDAIETQEERGYQAVNSALARHRLVGANPSAAGCYGRFGASTRR
jgi:hypothetical protein